MYIDLTVLHKKLTNIWHISQPINPFTLVVYTSMHQKNISFCRTVRGKIDEDSYYFVFVF